MTTDKYRGVSDTLVDALAAAKGDEAEEEAAMRAAIAGYVEINGSAELMENGLADYFIEEGSVQNPPALERVPGATEEDMQRWRNKFLDLAGY